MEETIGCKCKNGTKNIFILGVLSIMGILSYVILKEIYRKRYKKNE